MSELQNRELVDLWHQKLEAAKKYKRQNFGDDAEEAMNFYRSPRGYWNGYKWEHGADSAGSGIAGVLVSNDLGHHGMWPTFKVNINKVFELVSIYRPFLYHSNPFRTVSPKRPHMPQIFNPMVTPPQENFLPITDQMGNPIMVDPNTGMPIDPANPPVDPNTGMPVQPMPVNRLTKPLRDSQAEMLQWYLNYTPNELHLYGECKDAITEGLIKGRGVVWHELLTTDDGRRLAGTVYDTVDNLIVDPDVEKLREAKWVARKVTEPVWKAEERFGWEYGTMLGNKASYDSRVGRLNTGLRQDVLSGKGETNNLIEYYEIYSRMGYGTRLMGANNPRWRQAAANDNGHVFLVIAKEVDRPLNLPPTMDREMDPGVFDTLLKDLTQWPTPFFKDWADPWPFTELDFYKVPRCSWPQSIIKTAMGELKFLNWVYSYMMGKIRVTSRDFILIPKEFDDELREKLLNGPDLCEIPVSSQDKDIIQHLNFLQHPQFNKDIWTVLSAVEQAFDKRTGLLPLMYAQSKTESRSATDAALKRDMINIRPDEMAGATDEWSSRVARKEAIMARHHLTMQDVSYVFGEDAAAGGPYSDFWQNFIRSQDTEKVVGEFDYRIENGTSRRPDKEKQVADIDESAQYILPMLQGVYQMNGDPSAINSWLQRWAETRDFNIEGLSVPDMQAFLQAQQYQQTQTTGQPVPEGTGMPNG